MSASWKTAYSAMKDNYSLTDDAIGLFALNLRFSLDDIQTIATEAITGGGDDKKCDVLYVDKERQIAVLAQCYVAQTAKASAPANKASDLNTAMAWMLSTPLQNLPDGLRGRADELRSAITAGEVRRVFIWYVHNLPGSNNVKKELKTVEVGARAALKQLAPNLDVNIFAEEIGDAELEKLYAQAERTVIVTDEITTQVQGALTI